MGLAIDTVGAFLTNASTAAAALSAATASPGDGFGIRAFKDTASCSLENVFLQGASPPRRARILSPRLHDNVTGVSYQAAESPAEFLLAAEYSQMMYSADVLQVQLDAAGSSSTVAGLSMYYTDLPGINANLLTWPQVQARIIDLKPVEVDVTSSATIGTWVDTLITTTDNQLKANYEYAVLGVEVSQVFTCVGVKGPATGNLRICAPGASPTLRLTDYFAFQSQQNNRPYIPIINANDRFATYVSVLSNTASQAGNVFLMMARLS